MALIDRLSGGKRGSLGAAKQVATEVLAHPEQLGEAVAALVLPDPVLVSRCAHVIMQVAEKQPDLVQPHKPALLETMGERNQWEVRLECSKAITKLRLEPREIHDLVHVFKDYLDAPQSFVKTAALQGLADLAQKDPDLTPMVRDLLSHYVLSGTPAMRARCRKLLAVLK